MYSRLGVTSLRTSSGQVIRAARVALPSGVSGPHAVTCEQGLITSVNPISTDYDDILLTPGFIDLQVNGIAAIDVAHARGDDWLSLDQALLQQGTTTWYPTLISSPIDSYAEKYKRISEAQNRSDNARPEIAGIHLEGPFLGEALGAHDPAHVQFVDTDWFSSIPANVRIVTIAPENAAAMAAIGALRARNVVVSIGHTRAPDDLTVAAIDAGAQLVTHLFNGMSGVHHRKDGVALVALTDDRVAVSLIADLVHVRPRAINLAFRSKTKGLILITDSVAHESKWAQRRGIAHHDGAPRLPDATLAGSSLAMNTAIKNVVQVCGVDLHSAIQAATATPARILGLSDRGSIAVGYRADLVALDSDFGVRRTWVAGELALSMRSM